MSPAVEADVEIESRKIDSTEIDFRVLVRILIDSRSPGYGYSARDMILRPCVIIHYYCQLLQREIR
jgi:hypothetical protein